MDETYEGVGRLQTRGRWGGGGLSREGEAAGFRRERRQSPALGALVAVQGISSISSSSIKQFNGSGRWGEAVGPGSSHPPPSASFVAVLFLVGEAAMVAAMSKADGNQRLMSQTTWTWSSVPLKGSPIPNSRILQTTDANLKFHPFLDLKSTSVNQRLLFEGQI